MNYALAIASAILLALIHPGADLTFLAPFALAPLLFACAREPRWKRRFLAGWAAGVVYWWAVCYWIQFVLEVHGGMGRFGSWGTFALFSLAKGLHMAVFATLVGWLMSRWWALPAVAALWAGLERTHGPLGFAWLELGNAGVDMAIPLRVAPVVGVYGLSFVFAMTAAAVALVALRRPRVELAWLAALAGLWALPPVAPFEQGSESAVVVQPNLDEEATWTPASADEMQKRLVLRSMESALDPALGKPSIVVWPESPGPFYYYTDATFRRYAADLARTTGAYFLFGTVAFLSHDKPLNSAVLLAPSGDLVDRYDKMFLVPFGEFIPPMFDFVNRITKEAGDFIPGDRVVVFPMAGHRLGTFICYESAFPDLVRRFPAAGAEVLANVSNDGYFGHSAALMQHLKLVRMRAVENRRWIVRATNDGITATVDPGGRITQSLKPAREDVARMRFGYVRETTFYTRHGDWFAWLCLIAGGLGAVAGAVRERFAGAARV
ncbi:MAG: apolipoprotein N-acyltransferase [Acidobacteria bacterium]|nr:apolipoprotein N-acyltransferase [Acidobacteriota bacterium]